MTEQEGKHSLHTKTVVITGASSGVGRAAALAFSSLGATVILAARRNGPLQELVKECVLDGGTAIAVPTDVTDPEEILRLVKAAVGFSGQIDIWINNAGVLAAGELTSTPVDVLKQVIETNLLGYIYGAHAVLPYFKKQGHGILINNISVGAWFPTPYASAYTASKYGLKGFTQSLRGELVHWPEIRICDLFSGFLDTPGIHHAANYTGHALMPAPPVYDPRRVASAMVQLAHSPRNSMTTDLLAPALKFAHQFFPGISRYVSARVIESYLKKAGTESPSSGNVLAPLRYGTSIDGGWQPKFRRKASRVGTALALFLAAGLLLSGIANR
jgi:NAD(P)-dependent dehydrogenase (short-subunit alcohol dehydrogenase family)